MNAGETVYNKKNQLSITDCVCSLHYDSLIDIPMWNINVSLS